MRFAKCTLLFLVPSSLAFLPSPCRTTANRRIASGGRPRKPSSIGALPSQTPAIVQEGLVGVVQFLDLINQRMEDTFQSTLRQGLDAITQSASEIQHLATELAGIVDKLDPAVMDQLQQTTSAVTEALRNLLVQYPALRPAYDTVTLTLQQFSITILPGLQSTPPAVSLLISSVLTYTIVSSLLSLGKAPAPSNPYPLKRYDAVAARAYFDRQFPMVLRRGLEIATASLGFGLKLLKDSIK